MRFLVLVLRSFFGYMPQFLVQAIAYGLGTIIYYVFYQRRRMMLFNLYYAFPHKDENWRKKIAKSSCRRMIELGLFLISSPFFGKSRLQKIITIDNSAIRLLEDNASNPRAQILVVPHFSLTEAIALYRGNKAAQKDSREIGVIFRPLNNKKLNDWVKQSRERLGLKLLSRKEGFSEAINILKRQGRVAILFDQNAGSPGILGTFFGRLVSSTQLPDLLAKKTNAECYVVYTERIGFWKACIHAEKLPDSNVKPLRISANDWLEIKLKENDNYCADWLWFHNRWKIQSAYYERYRIDTKKSDLDFKTIKVKNQLWFRMPNWLGDIIMTLPILRAIKKGRPNGEITLLVQKAFIPLLQRLEIADKIIELPQKNWKYFLHFWTLRKHYPESIFLFTNSERGDLEAWLTRAPQRFGMIRPRKKRPLLTHSWKMPSALDETLEHQTHVWTQCMHYFGLNEEVNFQPFNESFNNHLKVAAALRFGLICGSENNPEKRWSEGNWRELIKIIINKYPSCEIYLYGTAKDKAITEEIAKGFSEEQVFDLAGKTNLIEFAQHLAYCGVVICNDTGGMHLANALGVPVIAIFGPTNPIRTGPLFNGKKIILQPFGCPATGGKNINGIQVAQVSRALEELLLIENELKVASLA